MNFLRDKTTELTLYCNSLRTKNIQKSKEIIAVYFFKNSKDEKKVVFFSPSWGLGMISMLVYHESNN